MTSADISPSPSGENVAVATRSTMLKLTNVDTFYGPSQVLHNVSLEVKSGEIVCLLGANAAGKTTTMKTIFGLVHPRRGTVEFEGERIERKLPGDIVRSGLVLVPEARRIFPQQSSRDKRRFRSRFPDFPAHPGAHKTGCRHDVGR